MKKQSAPLATKQVTFLAVALLTVGATATIRPAAAQTATPTTQATRPAIAVAGSPLVVPGNYREGIIRAWDHAKSTITVDDKTYLVHSSKVTRNLSIGDKVIVSFFVDHYGPAAREIALGVVEVDEPISQD